MTGAVTWSAAQTFSVNPLVNAISERTSDNGVDVDGVLCKDGFVNVLITADPASPSEGDVWYDNTANALQYRDDSTSQTIATQGNITRLYLNAAKPVYASASTFTIDECVCKDSGNTAFINVSSQKTINLATTGINGIAQSAALTGTVSTTASSATITGSGTAFDTDYVSGDVIVITGGDTLVIDSVPSATSMTATSNASTTVSGAAHKRGGEANDAWYYLFAIDDGTTPGYILSTRDVSGGATIADLPSGYTLSRQLAFSVRNDGSGDLVPFTVGAGWPTQPYIQYEVTQHKWGDTVGPTNVLESGNNSPASTFTDVDCSSYVPPNSRLATFWMVAGTASNAAGFIRSKGESHNGIPYVSLNGSAQTAPLTIATDSSQTIQYERSINSVTTLDINVVGFVVTEVV